MKTIIENVKDTAFNGIIGEAVRYDSQGNEIERRAAAFTFATNCWYYNDKPFAGYIPGTVEVKH